METVQLPLLHLETNGLLLLDNNGPAPSRIQQGIEAILTMEWRMQFQDAVLTELVEFHND